MYSTENYWTRHATKMGTSAKKKEDRMKETESSKGEKQKVFQDNREETLG